MTKGRTLIPSREKDHNLTTMSAKRRATHVPQRGQTNEQSTTNSTKLPTNNNNAPFTSLESSPQTDDEPPSQRRQLELPTSKNTRPTTDYNNATVSVIIPKPHFGDDSQVPNRIVRVNSPITIEESETSTPPLPPRQRLPPSYEATTSPTHQLEEPQAARAETPEQPQSTHSVYPKTAKDLVRQMGPNLLISLSKPLQQLVKEVFNVDILVAAVMTYDNLVKEKISCVQLKHHYEDGDVEAIIASEPAYVQTAFFRSPRILLVNTLARPTTAFFAQSNGKYIPGQAKNRCVFKSLIAAGTIQLSAIKGQSQKSTIIQAPENLGLPSVHRFLRIPGIYTYTVPFTAVSNFPCLFFPLEDIISSKNVKNSFCVMFERGFTNPVPGAMRMIRKGKLDEIKIVGAMFTSKNCLRILLPQEPTSAVVDAASKFYQPGEIARIKVFNNKKGNERASAPFVVSLAQNESLKIETIDGGHFPVEVVLPVAQALSEELEPRYKIFSTYIVLRLGAEKCRKLHFHLLQTECTTFICTHLGSEDVYGKVIDRGEAPPTPTEGRADPV